MGNRQAIPVLADCFLRIFPIGAWNGLLKRRMGPSIHHALL